MNSYQKQIDFFLAESRRHWKSSQSLFKTKHYDWALFVGHLTLEKLLKAVIIKNTNQPAPYIHNLQELVRRTESNPTQQQIEDLGEITTFNIEARYDTVQFAFYKRCTKTYTQRWLSKIGQLKIWLEKNLKNQ